MASRSFSVDYYYVYIGTQISSPKRNGPARIYCYGTEGALGINFITPGGLAWPQNYSSSDARRGEIYVPAEQFSWYMDILRYEKPIRAYINSDLPVQNRLYTGKEPIGEGEEESQDTMTNTKPPPPIVK